MTPCGRDRCLAADCPGFDANVGCKNRDLPPLSWSRWYVERFGEKEKLANEIGGKE